MKPFFQRFKRKGLICAHRGARSIAPENTFYALEQARQCGADLWETDVQLTADGELVLFHDETLERTTDIIANPSFQILTDSLVSQFSFSDLQQLNAGRWFIDSDPFGTIRTQEINSQNLNIIAEQTILGCRAALEYCRQHQFPVNLEIKDHNSTALGETVVERLVELIETTNTEDLVLISSFNHDYLRLIHHENRNLATAALVGDTHPDDLIEYLKSLNCDAYHPHWKIADKALIHSLNQHQIEVNVWTVNECCDVQNFKKFGAFFVCTDWPQKML